MYDQNMYNLKTATCSIQEKLHNDLIWKCILYVAASCQKKWIHSLSLVSLCWSVRMSNFGKSIICDDAPVWWSYGYWCYEFGKFSFNIRILQVVRDLGNSISYSGLLGLDWNYPWRTGHEARRVRFSCPLNHGQTVVIRRRPSLSTLCYFLIVES